jgi:hypothetical protein
MNHELHRFTRAFWAEKTPCGEMWIGRYVDEQTPGRVQQTKSYGDHDTAVFHARMEHEKRCCTGYRCHAS